MANNHQFIVINKPAGIGVQPDKTGDKSLLSLAEIYSKSTLYLIHRIDRPASGLIIFAKNKNALAFLNEQFKERKAEKIYLAVVKERPAQEKGLLTHYLKKNQQSNKTIAFDQEEKGSKLASLEYEVLSSIENYHLLKIILHSGRHHQIRAQLAAIGSPIRGDVKYGFRRGNRDRSIHLHAWKLGIKRPVSNQKEWYTAPFPKDPVWDAFAEDEQFKTGE